MSKNNKIEHKVVVKPVMRAGKPAVYENARRTIIPRKGEDGKLITGHTEKQEAEYPFVVDTNFWNNYKIVLTHKTRELNLNNSKDLLDYRFMRADKEFANSLKDVNTETTYILYDEVTEAKDKNKEFDDNYCALGYIKDMNENERARFLTLFGGYKTMNVSPDVIMNELTKRAKQNPADFCKRYEDKNKVVKMLIKELVALQILRTDKLAYFYGELTVGANIELAIDYINDMKNQDIVLQWKKILEERKQPVLEMV